MEERLIGYGINSYLSQNILIVPFQADFYEEIMRVLSDEIMKKLHENQEIKGLIIDLSQVPLIDLNNMMSIKAILKSAELLGVICYVSGIQPLVSFTLVEIGFDSSNMNMALDINQAIECIQNKVYVSRGKR